MQSANYYIFYKFIEVNVMSQNNDKKTSNYYFPLFIGIGLIFGIIINQLATGLCLGVAIGLALDYKKKK